MKYLRKHYLIFISVFLLLSIIGTTSLDLKINQGVYNQSSVIATFIGAFGMMPGCGMLALIGGILINSSKLTDKKIIKILSFFCSFILCSISIFFIGGEVFGVNGYNIKEFIWLGYLFAVIFSSLFFILGYILSMGMKEKSIWVILLVFIGMLFIALVVCLLGLKELMHRPRYRFIVREGITPFYPWYRVFRGTDDVLNHFSYITKEEFRSFPSAHSTMSTLVIVLMANLFIFKKDSQKHHVYFMYIAFGYNVFVAVERIVIGAHYLSDVSIGALIMLICGLLFNELLIKSKRLSQIIKANI